MQKPQQPPKYLDANLKSLELLPPAPLTKKKDNSDLIVKYTGGQINKNKKMGLTNSKMKTIQHVHPAFPHKQKCPWLFQITLLTGPLPHDVIYSLTLSGLLSKHMATSTV